MIRFIDEETRKDLLKFRIYRSTLDEIIEELRVKYGIHIYSTPFVIHGLIKYRACALILSGNNFLWWKDILDECPKKQPLYVSIHNAKRNAIRVATRWILTHKCKKVSIKQRTKKQNDAK